MNCRDQTVAFSLRLLMLHFLVHELKLPYLTIFRELHQISKTLGLIHTKLIVMFWLLTTGSEKNKKFAISWTVCWEPWITNKSTISNLINGCSYVIWGGHDAEVERSTSDLTCVQVFLAKTLNLTFLLEVMAPVFVMNGWMGLMLLDALT